MDDIVIEWRRLTENPTDIDCGADPAWHVWCNTRILRLCCGGGRHRRRVLAIVELFRDDRTGERWAAPRNPGVTRPGQTSAVDRAGKPDGGRGVYRIICGTCRRNVLLSSERLTVLFDGAATEVDISSPGITG
jgi:hypothetical protein